MLKLFDSTVLPILLYGSEVWGYSNLDYIDKLHLKFLQKKINSQCNGYGELGRHPISVQVKSRMLNYWRHIAPGNVVKLSSILYKLMLNISNEIKCKWIQFVEKTLNDLGLSNIYG